ncbi:purine and uridine phosphorylase [Clavulina sp. PMI_390]|nr:purine and uridine phosphorylase [Clavulina sp. PMI_390]
MKDTVTDSNFPRTSEGRVYHLGLKHGELANRILTVGDPARATSIAQLLGPLPESNRTLRVESERGFLMYTGLYKGVPLSIVAIGMGFANMDFLVREGRECVDGDMYMIRFGSCGCLTDLPVGSIVAPKESVSVTRNYDFDFGMPFNPETWHAAYRISKPAISDPTLHEILVKSLKNTISQDHVQVLGECTNASADSFYSSQGRITSFNDHNDSLIDHLLETVPGVTTLEMETFHLLHLAQSYNRSILTVTSNTLTSSSATDPNLDASLPVPQTRPPAPGITRSPAGSSPVVPTTAANTSDTPSPLPVIHNRPPARGLIFAAAAQMIFASRVTANAFITPEEVVKTQEWGGKACLDALAQAGVH